MSKKTIINPDQVLRSMLSSNKLGTFFGVSQEVLDNVWNSLTSPDGNSVTYISMEIGADRDVFHPVQTRLLEMDVTGSTNPDIDKFIKMFLKGPSKIPNYGGGLGILAGDTLKSFADNKIPVLGISLLYKKGYFSQLVDSQIGQIAWNKEWEPENTPSLYLLKDPENPDIPLQIKVPFFNRNDEVTHACAQLLMKMEVADDLEFFVPEVLLDFSVESSPDFIKDAAQLLYDSSSERTKAIQRRLLGTGVVPVMKALGITSKTIHLNEQHGVTVVLNLIIQLLEARLGHKFAQLATDQDIHDAAREVAERIIYTIHTPVKAGHDRFDRGLFSDIAHSFSLRVLNLLANDREQPSHFNFTTLAMHVNRATNSVSRLHREVTKRQFPQYSNKITAVTNGVHHLTWISDAKAELYDSFSELKNWRKDPGVFANASLLKKNNRFITYLEQAWMTDTKKLISYVNDMLITHRAQMQETWIDPPNFLSHLDEEIYLDAKTFTIGFARRFSTYKRADLIFENLDTLSEIITSRNWPVNFIFAGKAHPHDEPGKTVIKQILDIQESLYNKTNGLAKLVFIPGYDMDIAKMMVAGVHAWLNNPKRPLEASGTSGMKAAMNAVPNISIMDGWWAEGYHDGQTGWKFGYETPVEQTTLSEDHSTLLYAEDSASFYRIFPEILEMFYEKESRPLYIEKCIMNIALNCTIFNTHRMVAEYTKRYNLKLPPAVEKKIKKFRKLYRSETNDE